MAGLDLSEQLRELSDPRPVEFHPDQEDWDLLSGSKLTQSRTYEDEGKLLCERRGVSTRRSKPRRRFLESEVDPRYAGKPVSRKQLYWDEREGEVSRHDRGIALDEVQGENDGEQSDDGVGSRDDEGEIAEQEAADRDSLSEESESENEEESDISSEGVEEGDGEDKKASEGGGFIALAMNRVQEDLEKGKAVKEQIRLWDGILEGRIKLHKMLNLTNSLPQLPRLAAFMTAGGEGATSSIQEVRRELRFLLDSLLQLQQSLLLRHRDTRGLSGHPLTGMTEEGDTPLPDEEVPSDLGSNEEGSEQEGDDLIEEGQERKRRRRKRKRKCPWRSGGYEEHISAVHTAFESYRNETISKWDTKLRLASGKLTNKSFVQVDRSTLAQIQHVLQDNERLVKRTQLKRSVYHILGREEEEEESHDSHLKSHDQEIYDEDDFYHQLLRDLIERKMNYTESADPVAMGRQWLALQKLRSKVKKKVDTKASKGRKIRYDIHPKLVGFMPPIQRGDMSNSSRNDLFLSLFGANS